MRRIFAPIILATTASAFLVGCTSTSKALGLRKDTPNEFNILTKAPLVIPPEYNLRPPRIGESSSEDNYSQRAAREALIGDIDAAEPSEGEALLMRQANVGRADPEIRLKIDGQNSVERKTQGFASRILFWQDGRLVNDKGEIVPLDSEGEAQRLESVNAATGGGQVEISKRPGGPKLPGL